MDQESGDVLARSNREVIDDSARQTLTQAEIEILKRDSTGAGKDIIAKLLLSHTALDQKTTFSLAKYKILKTKKYIRRFQVLPLDVATFGKWMIEDKDPTKALDMREEMVGLLGCLGNVHYGGEDVFLGGDVPEDSPSTDETLLEQVQNGEVPLTRGRWLVIDDTSGLLVAAMAERMGILYPKQDNEESSLADIEAQEKRGVESSSTKPGGAEAAAADTTKPPQVTASNNGTATGDEPPQSTSDTHLSPDLARRQRSKARPSDFRIPHSQTNTITLIHPSSQPNVSFLNYYGFDVNNPNHDPHPMFTHLLPVSWLQLLDPSKDTAYSIPPPVCAPEEIASWKASRRGHYHRKRRRYTRTRHIVDATRAGGFSGLVCATSMDMVSILRHTLPLLEGGAPVALYSPSLEPLVELADCFSAGRRSAWVAHSQEADLSAEEMERWPGSEEFPVNPSLLLGATIQTSRARKWQVLPSRTHPLMMDRGGAEGYVFTGWRAKPAEGRVEARGKFKRRKKEDQANPTPV